MKLTGFSNNWTIQPFNQVKRNSLSIEYDTTVWYTCSTCTVGTYRHKIRDFNSYWKYCITLIIKLTGINEEDICIELLHTFKQPWK